MSDRGDKARADLLALWREELWFTDSTERNEILDFVLDQRILVLLALGMRAVPLGGGVTAWAEPDEH